MDIIRCPRIIDIPKKVKKRNKHLVWTPPANGQIKVNGDESFLGGYGRGGIRGIFLNSRGREVLIQFGKEVELDLAVYVEVLALREGILVVAALRWASSHSFLFESDSQSVVAWVEDPSSAPLSFHNILDEC